MRYPKAKLVVHAGYSYINESDEPKRMAQYFKEWSGIDPLTIDQTEMMEHSSPDYENPLYARVLKKYQPAEAMLLRKRGNLVSAQPDKRDLTVFHPRTIYEDGRPNWLAQTGRKTYKLPAAICGSAKSCLVRARLRSRGTGAQLRILTTRMGGTRK